MVESKSSIVADAKKIGTNQKPNIHDPINPYEGKDLPVANIEKSQPVFQIQGHTLPISR
jgi:hypothetical protein